MTKGEKMIWAAVYAADWRQQQEDYANYGPSRPVSAVTSVENAWAAVSEARESFDAVVDAFGEGPQIDMLREMVIGCV